MARMTTSHRQCYGSVSTSISTSESVSTPSKSLIEAKTIPDSHETESISNSEELCDIWSINDRLPKAGSKKKVAGSSAIRSSGFDLTYLGLSGRTCLELRKSLCPSLGRVNPGTIGQQPPLGCAEEPRDDTGVII